MKKEKIVKKILVRSLAGFPVGVMLLMCINSSNTREYKDI